MSNTIDFIIFISIPVVIGLMLIAHGVEFRKNATQTWAEITKINAGAKGFELVEFTFLTEKGESIEAKLAVSGAWYNVGDKIDFLYLPKHPKMVANGERIESFIVMGVFSIVLSIIFLGMVFWVVEFTVYVLLVLGGMALIIFGVRKTQDEEKVKKHGVKATVEAQKIAPSITSDEFNKHKVKINLLNNSGEYIEMVVPVGNKEFPQDRINVMYLPENPKLVITNEPDIIRENVSDICRGVGISVLLIGLYSLVMRFILHRTGDETIGILGIFVIVIFIVSLIIFVPSKGKIKKHGIKTTAKVIKVKHTITADNDNPSLRLHLTFNTNEGQYVSTSVSINAKEFTQDSVDIIYWPKNPHNLIVTGDYGSNGKLQT